MSFAALALRARAANDTTRAQINNIPSKSHVIPLMFVNLCRQQPVAVYTGKNIHILSEGPHRIYLIYDTCLSLFYYQPLKVDMDKETIVQPIGR